MSSQTVIDIIRAVRHRLRSKWQLAAACFLLGTVGFFAGIRIMYKSFSQLSPKNFSSVVKKTDRSPKSIKLFPYSNEENERKALFQKLAVDDQHLDMLEEKRKHTSHPFTGTTPKISVLPHDSPGISTENKVRAQLSSALVHLINLEKHDASDDPEIIAAREQITRLQGRMAQVTVNAPPMVLAPLPRQNQAQLVQIDAEVSLCETQIIADLQRLARLTTPVQRTDTVGGLEKRADALDAENSTPTESQNLISGTSRKTGLLKTPDKTQASRQSSYLILAISIAIGFVFSICAVILSDRLDGSILDEAMLRNLLPATAEYVGSVPRMKT